MLSSAGAGVGAEHRRDLGILPACPSRGSLQPLPGDALQLVGGFWRNRQQLNADKFLPHCDAWVERMGWLDHFRLAAVGRPSRERRGKWFTDSDVYKLLEALIWEAAGGGKQTVEQRVGEITRQIAAAQEPDGYLNTYWGGRGREQRYVDLAHGHELYCAGHLLQAVVARLRTTGEDELTRVGIRQADRICEDFGPAGIQGFDGHPVIEVALAELYRATGETRYLEQARLFLERHGLRSLEPHPIGHEYYQDDAPIRAKTVFSGHVIRALYFAAAGVDIAVETGDDELLDAVIRQWDETIARRTYITGGMGSRHLGESFGGDYELPPDRAYTETCGGVASVMVAWRLLLATGEVRFADAMERALFNMVATALDLTGERFFYVNPLHQRHVGITVADDEVPFRKDTLRAPWFWVSCCPTNVARLLASLTAYFATRSERGLQLHHYASGTLRAQAGGAGSVAVRIGTDYPWDGNIRIVFDEAGTAPWELSLRVPAWARDGATLTVGGETTSVGPGYVRLERSWRAGEEIVLNLPVKARLTWPDGRIDAVRDTVAVERGPLVYALESPDLPADVPLGAVTIDAAGDLSDTRPSAGLPSDAQFLRAKGFAVPLPEPPAWPIDEKNDARTDRDKPFDLILIPYHLWSNRGPSTMRVFVPVARPRLPAADEAPTKGEESS